MRLDTEIFTSKGVCNCVIQRVLLSNKEVFQVDVWRSEEFMGGSFIAFCSCVYMRLEGPKYTIIDKVKSRRTSEYWQELENTLSNTIMLNE